jgi:restriction endonuclease S subunit
VEVGSIVVFETKKLGEIAKINTGLVVKRKQAKFTEKALANYKMLTLKSFEYEGCLNIEELDYFYSIEKLDDKYLTCKGDVIIRLSYPNKSIAINKDNEGILIPSLFAVIRLWDNAVLPEYLSIYLNSDEMKEFYAKTAIGSAIQIIKTSLLKDIIVKIPKIEIQQKTIELYTLMLKEKALLDELMEEKVKYNKAVLRRLIAGGINNGN